VCIPATITEIDTTDGSDVVIHDHDLFVVRPKLNRIYGRYSTEQTPIGWDPMNSTLTTDVIRMPHNDDIGVERLQGMLRPPRRHVHCLGDLGSQIDVGRGQGGSGHNLPPCTQ
jgi:hypothetical protein